MLVYFNPQPFLTISSSLSPVRPKQAIGGAVEGEAPRAVEGTTRTPPTGTAPAGTTRPPRIRDEPTRTPPVHNYTQCCIDAKVSCLGFCNIQSILDGNTGQDPESCEADFPAIVKCMAGESFERRLKFLPTQSLREVHGVWCTPILIL